MKFNRYTIMVGLNDKDTMHPVKTIDDARLELGGRLAQLGIGATLARGTGVYKHERGDVVVEETVVISIIDFEGSWQKVAQSFYDGVKRDYNQESIAVITDTVESELI